jgi:hypothetical protein
MGWIYFILTQPAEEEHVVSPFQLMPPPRNYVTGDPEWREGTNIHCCQSGTTADTVPTRTATKAVEKRCIMLSQIEM